MFRAMQVLSLTAGHRLREIETHGSPRMSPWSSPTECFTVTGLLLHFRSSNGRPPLWFHVCLQTAFMCTNCYNPARMVDRVLNEFLRIREPLWLLQILRSSYPVVREGGAAVPMAGGVAIAAERVGGSGESALLVRRRWCDEILSRRKVWELRGTRCNLKIGRQVWLAQSRSGGLVMGSVTLVSCKLVGVRNQGGGYSPPVQAEGDPADFFILEANAAKHRVPLRELAISVKYKKVWVVDALRFRDPVRIEQRRGCVQWTPLVPADLLKCKAAARMARQPSQDQ